MTCDDFRGITISPVLAKVFENCFLVCFKSMLISADNQSGFKKGIGCNHAINTVRNIVNSITTGGNTANLCAINLTKAFDKVNHHALFMKLMKRCIPVKLLGLLESLFSYCCSCVKCCLLYTSPSPRDRTRSRMPSSA